MASMKKISTLGLVIVLAASYHGELITKQRSSAPSAYDKKEDEKIYVIDKIIVKGLKSLPLDTIMSSIPYKKGQVFDPSLSSKLIKNIYNLGYFKQIKVELE